jgi:hypothetical protein
MIHLPPPNISLQRTNPRARFARPAVGRLSPALGESILVHKLIINLTRRRHESKQSTLGKR